VTAHHPDPAFPRLHGRPPHGWVNDPNGCSYIDGRYHLFFQHNPDAAVHATIKWGHVSSTDLVDWRHEPIALVNRHAELDAYGCWTGCVVDDGGVPTAVYSAVADDSGRAEVMLARSDREMQTWVPGSSSVMGMPADHAITDVRDPFVFEVDGRRYAMQGAGHRQGRPKILVYGCDDLTAWTELGTLLSADDPVAAEIAPANVWECPNLFRLGDRWVLIVSLWREVDGTHSLDGTRYLVGDLVVGSDGPRFTPTSGGLLDDGPCFYAPQVLATGGRVLLWAWSWEHGRSAAEVDAAGWAGVLTFCRELSLLDDVVVSQPAPELAALRRERFVVRSEESFRADAYEVELETGEGSLLLLDAGAEQLVAEWEVPSSRVTTPRLLVDGSMVEVHAGGSTAYTTRAYPTATSEWRLRFTGRLLRSAWHLGVATGDSAQRDVLTAG
jgi:beta-fructofuranosidase